MFSDKRVYVRVSVLLLSIFTLSLVGITSVLSELVAIQFHVFFPFIVFNQLTRFIVLRLSHG